MILGHPESSKPVVHRGPKGMTHSIYALQSKNKEFRGVLSIGVPG